MANLLRKRNCQLLQRVQLILMNISLQLSFHPQLQFCALRDSEEKLIFRYKDLKFVNDIRNKYTIYHFCSDQGSHTMSEQESLQ